MMSSVWVPMEPVEPRIEKGCAHVVLHGRVDSCSTLLQVCGMNAVCWCVCVRVVCAYESGNARLLRALGMLGKAVYRGNMCCCVLHASLLAPAASPMQRDLLKRRGLQR